MLTILILVLLVVFVAMGLALIWLSEHYLPGECEDCDEETWKGKE